MEMPELDDSQGAVHIDYTNIKTYTRTHTKWTFVDEADVIPGKSARGKKLASLLDWYFELHFPGDPVMPGVLIMEFIMMTGALILTTLPEKNHLEFLFRGCDNLRFYREVRPGDILTNEVELISYRRGVAQLHGTAKAGDALVCTMQFTIVAPEELPPPPKVPSA